MTLPNERTRAVLNVREFLVRLSTPYVEKGLKKIPMAVRAEARALLRHYPTTCDLLYPDTAFDPGVVEAHIQTLDEAEGNGQKGG